ncbi:MAG TPA: flagellar biosynthetic protein FliO [Terracidiphilus sp.]|nr:flagellar biosynthetic protein FliO [Terracidiphilus sp.]
MGFRINREGVPGGGLAGWLLSWWRGRVRGRARAGPRMTLLERIPLAPRQTLCLVEVEGRRFLIATSPEGAPSFYALDARRAAAARARVSW